MGVPGEVHRGAPVEVERFDVRLPHEGRGGRPQVGEELLDRRALRRGQLGGGELELGYRAEELVVGVLEQDGEELPAHALFPRKSMKVTFPPLPAVSGSPPNGSFALLSSPQLPGPPAKSRPHAPWRAAGLTPSSPCAFGIT